MPNTKGALYSKVKPIQTDFSKPSQQFLKWAMQKDKEEKETEQQKRKLRRKKRKEQLDDWNERMNKLKPADAKGRWDSELNELYNKVQGRYADITRRMMALEDAGLERSDEWLRLKTKQDKLMRVPGQVSKASKRVFQMSKELKDGIQKGEFSKYRNDKPLEKLSRGLSGSDKYDKLWQLELTDDAGVKIKWRDKNDKGDVVWREQDAFEFSQSPFNVDESQFALAGDAEGTHDMLNSLVGAVTSDEEEAIDLGVKKRNGQVVNEKHTLSKFSSEDETTFKGLVKKTLKFRPNTVKDLAAKIKEKNETELDQNDEVSTIKFLQDYYWKKTGLGESDKETKKARSVDENRGSLGDLNNINTIVKNKKNVPIYAYKTEDDILKAEKSKKFNSVNFHYYPLNGDFNFESKRLSGIKFMMKSSPTGDDISFIGDEDEKEDSDVNKAIKYNLGRMNPTHTLPLKDVTPQAFTHETLYKGDKSFIVKWDRGDEEGFRTFITQGSRVPEELLKESVEGKLEIREVSDDPSRSDKSMEELWSDPVGAIEPSEIRKNTQSERAVEVTAELTNNNEFTAAIPWGTFKEEWMGAPDIDAANAWGSMYPDENVNDIMTGSEAPNYKMDWTISTDGREDLSQKLTSNSKTTQNEEADSFKEQ